MASWLFRILLSDRGGTESERGRTIRNHSFDQLVTRLGKALMPTKHQITFHGDVDSRGQKQASKAIVEDLVALQSGCGVVGDFNTWRRRRKKNLPSAPKGDTNRGGFVLLWTWFWKKLTCSEAVKNAVLAEYWMAVGTDKHTGLSVPEDVVLFQQTYRERFHSSNYRYTGAKPQGTNTKVTGKKMP